jgi:hypothetical protein
VLANGGTTGQLPTPRRMNRMDGAYSREKFIGYLGRRAYDLRERLQILLARRALATLDAGDLRLGPAEALGNLLAGQSRVLTKLAEPGAERLTSLLVIAAYVVGQRPP